MQKLPAVFVSSATALKETKGGVQQYTRELLLLLEAAGFALRKLPYNVDRRPTTRLRRRFLPRPYLNRIPAELTGQIASMAEEIKAPIIFLNQGDLSPVAERLHMVSGPRSPRIVLLSHGLESVDYLHATADDDRVGESLKAVTLGRQLLAEKRHRSYIDIVLCMSVFEAEIERWLGAKRVEWLPRLISPSEPLEWNPSGDRIGCVGTWDHPPTLAGMAQFLRAFQPLSGRRARFRLVGGPPASGRFIADQFSCVDYLGPLPDTELRAEAASWSCFVNPIFTFSRGASTKLAVALGWSLPVVTTAAGARGYEWNDGKLSMSDDSETLAQLAFSLLMPAAAKEAARQVRRVADSSPSLNDLAARLAKILI